MNNQSSLAKQVLLGIPIVGLAAIAMMMVGAKKESSAPTAKPESDRVTVSKEGAANVGLETEVVKTTVTEDAVTATGQVLYPVDTTVKISPRLQGRVKAVYVRVGDAVKQGQTLAVLDSVDAASARSTALQNDNALRLAEKNLARAQRQFELGTPEVTQAQSTYDQAVTARIWAKDSLEKVKLQAKIGGFTEKPVEDASNALVSALSALSQAQSDFSLAQKDLTRKRQLVEIGVAAKSDLDISTDVYEKAKANLDAAKETAKLARQAVERETKAFKANLYADQQVNQARSTYEQADLQVQSATRALGLAKVAIRTALEQAKSDLRTAQLNVAASRQQMILLGQPGADGTLAITSPITGVVMERFVGPGQVVDQSQMTPWQMFTVARADVVWVEASIYEKDLRLLSEGAPVTIKVGALPNLEFSGRVLHISPGIDKSSRALKVRAEIDNASGKLKDGMYADVSIRLPAGRPQVTIPLSAVVQEQDHDAVFLVKDDGYVKRAITVSGQKSGRAFVERGLSAGDRIVTHGALFLGHKVSGD